MTVVTAASDRCHWHLTLPLLAAWFLNFNLAPTARDLETTNFNPGGIPGWRCFPAFYNM